MADVRIKVNGEERIVDHKMTFEKLALDYQEHFSAPVALVYQNGKIRELFRKIDISSEIEFITLATTIGHKTYERTATMLFFKALYDCIGKDNIKKAKIEFSLGAGLFFRCEGNFTMNQDLVEQIKSRMEELRDQKIPFYKTLMHKSDAVRIFQEQGMHDKVELIRYRNSSEINVYSLDDYYDYYYGYMLPNTSYLTRFQIEMYEGGIMLLLPKKRSLDVIPKLDARVKLFQVLDKSTKWNETMHIDTVGDLNKKICDGKFEELVLVHEALMEKRIGEIAEEIASKSGVKFIMIAGPSSSGKTSFANRLSIQLMAQGLSPHPIGVDNYFVNREFTPVDEDGNFNFECLEAIDTKQFNLDMTRLLNGESVDLPHFDFVSGKREYNGDFLSLGEEDVLVIEGIHALNDQMSYDLPKESKYKIYISALTTLNVDEHNRIPTTDARLIRRMVRDARTRGASAKRTIQMWPSVRKGEELNIFPYQESTDVMFNSTLIYELSVLKQYAEPILYNIKPDEEEYYEAQRLLKFLSYFLGVSTEGLPNNSLIREFVGGSCFNV